MLKKNEKGGISLRTIHLWMIVGAIILSVLMFLATHHLFSSFERLTRTSETQIELRKAARELMDASDYLTENVQRFTLKGDRQFLDAYFKEAFETNHREDAISKMSSEAGNSSASKSLQTAMVHSLRLMELEYYAMRLVIEAKGFTDYPEVLDTVILSEEDLALDNDGKLRKATETVLGDNYYMIKNIIRANMQKSLDELEEMAYSFDDSAMKELRDELTMIRTAILLQTLGIVFMVWLTSKLGIHPVLNAVDRIKEDSPIPEVGANEFRYLARTYNRMYEVYKRSLEHLNFKASHDELTGAYNRSGYDLLFSSIELESTYMVMIDVDNFKSINDTYGHETGDKVLIKIVQTLRNNFRSDDYICRIGGDEFVVFMVHAEKNQRDLIAEKIDRINGELKKTDDGLPKTSISVGIVHGSDATDTRNLFAKTDEAMYLAKQSGKSTYRFVEKPAKQAVKDDRK